MRLFKRRSVDTSVRECGFCGNTGFASGSFVMELRDSYGTSQGYFCRSCEEGFFDLESRLEYTSMPGRRPWLLPDPGTEHDVKAARAPFDAVHAAVRDLGDHIGDIPRAAARIAAVRLSIYTASYTPCDSREEAVATVSDWIAGDLAEHHKSLQEEGDERDYRVSTVSLFGRGCGMLFQHILTDGNWSRQKCFLIDTDYSIHGYTSWDR